MQIEIPFEAALILEETSLKTDHPELWTRYLNNRHIRYTRRVGARVFTSVGREDLRIIRDYFSLWLQYESLLPEGEQDRLQVNLAQYAANVLTMAIETPSPATR